MCRVCTVLFNGYSKLVIFHLKFLKFHVSRRSEKMKGSVMLKGDNYSLLTSNLNHSLC